MVQFREFILSSGTKVIAGKNAQNNEDLIKQIQPNEIVLHTANPGSPFVNIKAKPKFLSNDIKKAAIITAKYSQDWRDNKQDVLVHKFKGKDISKNKKMKLGTFGVKNFKIIKVKKNWIKDFEECQNI